MKSTLHGVNGNGNDQNQRFKRRLELHDTVYKSATEALEAYIAQFEGVRSFTTYQRRPSDLLSPAPKFYFMDSLERRLNSSSNKSPAKKVDELLEWVNVAYAKELSTKVVPFGYSATSKLSTSDEENMNPFSVGGYPSRRSRDDELSTLPSPSSSVVDLDSNAGTVETEVLLSSYKGIHQSSSGAYSHMASFKSPPKPRPVKNRSRHDGNSEYPSWVSGLGKEYPSWVEDLDSSSRHKNRSPSPDKKYSSSGHSSSSETEIGKTPSMSGPSRSTPALKISDLRGGRSHPSKRVQEPSTIERAETKMNGVDWNDAASIDTDVLLSQSVYGPNPVNMGGEFHNSLYKDKRVARLKKESTKKLRKGSGKEKSTEHSLVPQRRSQSLTFSPTKTSGRNGEPFHARAETKESTPVRHKVREFSPERSPFTELPARYSLPPQSDRYSASEVAAWHSTSPKAIRYSLPPQSDRYGASEVAAWHSTSPQAIRYSLPPQPSDRYRTVAEQTGSQMYISPPAVTRYSRPFTPKQEEGSPLHATRQLYEKFSDDKLPSRSNKQMKINIPSRRDDSDLESEDTDRVMRKSPTGIKMEKIYRDPSTMYPWKLSMIQSSKSQANPAEVTHSKVKRPQYHSTPAVLEGSSSAALQAGRRNQQKDAFSAARTTFEGRYARTADNFKLTPKTVFASSSYRQSRDEKLAKSAPNARYSKPSTAPRSRVRNLTHKRSKTVPDLRRFAITSATRPAMHSRRSLDDDVISLNTVDTESLITRPPMPVFLASPSLTTVSDSETLVDSETETEIELGVARGRQPSSRHVTEVQHNDDQISPTSAFAWTNPHAAVREKLPERFQLWKLDDDTIAPDSFINRRFTSPKSGVISSFLEDCLSVDSDDPKLTKADDNMPSARLSGKEAAPGPVEALKQMLFTMQDMAHHEALDNSQSYMNTDFKTRDAKDFSESDNQSEKDSDIFRGEVSLQRAYHHLERLKRLVGREDGRSSVSSVS